MDRDLALDYVPPVYWDDIRERFFHEVGYLAQDEPGLFTEWLVCNLYYLERKT